MLNITTPAILFPAITLLMLAYTNRFLALSQLIRALHQDYQKDRTNKTLQQIKHLRYRVVLIRLMQAFGATSILCCTVSIIGLIFSQNTLGLIMFIISLIVFLGSITCSLIEILLSSRALNILLADIENDSDEY
tara:strand:- start:155 stop:556 length:402 start_codon:yes stop_codon:yes gene_type:complete